MKYSKRYVVTDPIFKDNLGVTGANRVTVPGDYHKVLYDGNDKMIGFILPNAKGTNPIEFYTASIDSIEDLIGINFFSELDDQIENQLEGTIHTINWSF